MPGMWSDSTWNRTVSCCIAVLLYYCLQINHWFNSMKESMSDSKQLIKIAIGKIRLKLKSKRKLVIWVKTNRSVWKWSNHFTMNSLWSIWLFIRKNLKNKEYIIIKERKKEGKRIFKNWKWHCQSERDDIHTIHLHFLICENILPRVFYDPWLWLDSKSLSIVCRLPHVFPVDAILMFG